LHLVRELRGICSNRSAVAWGAPLIRWSDDGAIVLAARPIASLRGKSGSGADLLPCRSLTLKGHARLRFLAAQNWTIEPHFNGCKFLF
jgi:hypothetical protein